MAFADSGILLELVGFGLMAFQFTFKKKYGESTNTSFKIWKFLVNNGTSIGINFIIIGLIFQLSLFETWNP